MAVFMFWQWVHVQLKQIEEIDTYKEHQTFPNKAVLISNGLVWMTGILFMFVQTERLEKAIFTF